jgi:uncharacterized membrane protein YhaH (DUF805 family)
MEWMFLPYRRYAEFEGRSGRQEYWMFFLFNVIVYTILGGVSLASFMQSRVAGGLGAPGNPLPVGGFIGLGLLSLFALATFIPSIAVQVRRFHDQDKSGWFILLGLIPYVGGIVLLIFMCLEGTRGPNRFGPDPRDPYNTNVFR